MLTVTSFSFLPKDVQHTLHFFRQIAEGYDVSVDGGQAVVSAENAPPAALPAISQRPPKDTALRPLSLTCQVRDNLLSLTSLTGQVRDNALNRITLNLKSRDNAIFA